MPATPSGLPGSRVFRYSPGPRPASQWNTAYFQPSPMNTEGQAVDDRSRIVPALHRIQRAHGYLDPDALKEFSRQSGIPLARLHEVGSFFPVFRRAKPPRVTVRVCRDMSCHLAGSAGVLAHLRHMADPECDIEGQSCFGRCDRAPAVCVLTQGDAGAERYYLGRTAGDLERIVAESVRGAPPRGDLDADLPSRSREWHIDPYRGEPSDYAGVKKAIAARDDAIRRGLDWTDAFLRELDDRHADLRGLGGAGVPASRKWQDVRDAVRTARTRSGDDRAFVVVNGDESEPGTFRDRELLLRVPHLIIEGVILAGLVTDALRGFVYIRHEYPEQIQACLDEIRRAEELGVCGAMASVLGRPFPISVFPSPGGYICGEQSALIEAMSDRRGEPRNLPPSLETNGLDDCPTLLSNVETFAWVPYIWLNGGEHYAQLGTNDWRGRRLFSISGDVERPGVYEVPVGLTVRELIERPEYCGGMKGGRALKAFAPSGPSGGFLPARLTVGHGLHTGNPTWEALARRRGVAPAATELDVVDLELELKVFRDLTSAQALGAGLVVYAEGRDMAAQAVNALEFFRNESCGKCVPCRVGSQKLASLGINLLGGRITADHWRSELMPIARELGEVMADSSICGLGRAVRMPLQSMSDFFDADVTRHLK